MRVISPLEDYFRQLFLFQFRRNLEFLTASYTTKSIACEISNWMEIPDLDYVEIIRFTQQLYFNSNLQINEQNEQKIFLQNWSILIFFVKIKNLLYSDGDLASTRFLRFLANFCSPSVSGILEYGYRFIVTHIGRC